MAEICPHRWMHGVMTCPKCGNNDRGDSNVDALRHELDAWRVLGFALCGPPITCDQDMRDGIDGQLRQLRSQLYAATGRAEAAEAKLAQLLARRFPVLDGGMTVPWQMLVPHEPQAMRNHSGQTLEDLAQRCGLDWVELACVLNGKPFTHCPTEHAKEFVLKRVAEYEAAQWVREQGKGGT